MGIILSVLGGVLQLVAFAIYNKQILKGLSKPNAATWTLWMFTSTLNCITYIIMSGDVVKGFLPIASTVACIATFFYALKKGKLSKLNGWDTTVLALGLVSAVVWWIFRSATYANLILQICILVSFIPTYRTVWNDYRTEKALPWFLWSLAYVFVLVAVILRWRGQVQDLVYPINCFVLHLIVGILAKPRKTQ